MISTGSKSYSDVSAYASVDDADPQQLVKLLFESLLARVNEARGHIERGEVAAKNEKIGKALRVVEGLQLSLDKERGGEIASNLERLYDYAAHALLRANLENSAAPLAEVAALMHEIKTGWDAIPAAARV